MPRLLLLLCSFIVAPAVLAASLSEGQVISPLQLSDQHGRPGKIDSATRLVLFSRDMKANKLAKAAFMDRAADYLGTAGTVYLIDVSPMPRFVTRTFAIPKMQKYGYRIYLDREGEDSAAFPSQKGRITAIHLEGLKVTRVEYVDSAAALNALVEGHKP